MTPGLELLEAQRLLDTAPTWVTIRTGDFAGQAGTLCRQRGTAAYVDIPGIGYVLCRLADIDFRPQRRRAT